MGKDRESFGTQSLKPGFWGFLVGWLVRLLFCVDVIDGAQQCSVSQVISGDIDGIHRHSCCAGFGCWFFLCYVSCCVR